VSEKFSPNRWAEIFGKAPVELEQLMPPPRISRERGKEKPSCLVVGFAKGCLPRASRENLGYRWNTALKAVFSPNP
jgi:hypothetical protein